MNQTSAIVIGSGFGGLAAAMRLTAMGYQVTVCEQLDAPGGRAYVYRQDGFTFDAGPTIVTAPFLLEELWALFDRKLSDDVELLSIDPFYRIRFHDGSHFDYSSDTAAMKAEIAKFNPVDAENFESFLKASQKLYEVGFDQLLYESFDSVSSMIKVLPDLVRTRFYSTVYRRVKNFFYHPKIRMVFSFHPLLIGGNPMTTTAIYLLIAHLERSFGVHYAMGGTGAIVNGMVKVIEEEGGTIRYNSKVEEILVSDGRAVGVRLAEGEMLEAPLVVSNADAAATYKHLLPAHHRKRWTDRRLARTNYSMSLFVWYFGTKRQYSDVPHHMIMLGPRYDGLLKDIFKHKVLADDFSLYLHRPTASDPSMAPEGCDAFYVLSPVPNLQSGIDWREQAEPYRQAIEQHLSETVLPDLKDELVTSHLLTPQEFQDRLGSVEGAGFSIQPNLTQTAWFRPHNISEEVPGLYLVGAGTHPGAGMPGVISSAKVLENLLKRDGLQPQSS
ncbi:MAG: phytoene desaturase [Pseudomonadota bacterium]